MTNGLYVYSVFILYVYIDVIMYIPTQYSYIYIHKMTKKNAREETIIRCLIIILII